MKTFSLNISYIHQFSYILTFPPYKEANDVILKQTDTPPPPPIPPPSPNKNYPQKAQPYYS